MATTIKLKSGSGAPLAGDLVAAEPAFDLTNKRLYTEDSGGTVIEVGTNPSTIDINAGTIDGTVIGGSSAAAGTFTTFTSTGIDDNATSTAITIDSSENVGINTTPALAGGVLSIEQGSGTHAIVANSNTSSAPSIYLRSIGGTATESHITFNDSTALLFTTTSTERMRIDSSGNVGIGTSSPADRLHLYSSSPALRLEDTAGYHRVEGYAGDMYITADQGASAGAAGNIIFRNNGANERMRIDSSGNVGIGTTDTGNAGFSVSRANGSNNVYARINGVATANEAGLQLSDQNTLKWTMFKPGSSNDLAFFNHTGGSEAMRIDSSGNVGIGTTSPNEKLVSNGAIRATGAATNIANADGALLDYAFGFARLTAGSAASSVGITFNTAVSGTPAERMRIDSSGNLLVGTTSAISGTNPAKQYIFGNTASQSCFQVTAGSSHTGIYALGAFSTVASASGSNVALVVQSGNGSTVTANNFYVYTNGDVKNTNNSYGAISDARLKSNIVDASSQIDDIMAVQVRSYTLNETGDRHIGVVAQELEESGMSGLVQEDEEGMKSVKYSVLYMKAIKALQEAVTRIETLEAEVAALKGA